MQIGEALADEALKRWSRYRNPMLKCGSVELASMGHSATPTPWDDRCCAACGPRGRSVVGS
jgi:hypothetical protein